MLVAMRNGQPDCVPAAPDMSNMIPCRLTGKPFWDIYLYHDPPLWMAYGDQCGRDTPEENILAMIEVARTYGRY